MNAEIRLRKKEYSLFNKMRALRFLNGLRTDYRYQGKARLWKAGVGEKTGEMIEEVICTVSADGGYHG